MIWQNYGHEFVASFFGPPCIVSPLRGTENLGGLDLVNYCRAALLRNLLSEYQQILIVDRLWSHACTNSENFILKVMQEIRRSKRLYSETWFLKFWGNFFLFWKTHVHSHPTRAGCLICKYTGYCSGVASIGPGRALVRPLIHQVGPCQA